MEAVNTKYVIGLDIGGTHIRIGAVTPEGTLHFFFKKKTVEILDSVKPIEALANFLKDYIEDHLSGADVLAIGIGFPSVVSKDKKSIYSTPNLNMVSNMNIVDPLQALVGKTVYINNDVNFLLQYEISQRQIAEDEIVLGFYVGTGFGNAIYLHQQFLDGKHGAAAELGHIPVYRNSEICQCGNVGCVEGIASGKRLVALHEQYFPETPFEDIFTNYTNDSVIEGFLEALAVPIATEINIFDPHVVIIGGGVVGMKGFPKKKLEDFILRFTRKPFPAEDLKFEYAEDTSSAGVLGAANYIYQQFKINGNVSVIR